MFLGPVHGTGTGTCKHDGSWNGSRCLQDPNLTPHVATVQACNSWDSSSAVPAAWPGCHHGRDQRSWRRHDISHCHLLPGCNPHFAAGRGHVQLQKSMVNMTASALSHHRAIFPSMLMLSVSLCMRRLHVHRADTGDLIDEPHKLPPPIVVGRAPQSWSVCSPEAHATASTATAATVTHAGGSEWRWSL